MPATTTTRYARGEQRRRALIDAAAALLLEQGLAALSHRAVAARAALPLASTTYYFASADDLRNQALQHLAREWAARAGAAVDALPDRPDLDQAARAIAQVVGAGESSDQMLLMYERYLDAGRHHRLRPVVVAWNARLDELVHRVLVQAGLPADDGHARLVLAVADGVAVTALAEGASVHEAVTATVMQTLSLLHRASRDRSLPS